MAASKEESKEEKFEMEYRLLGESGLKVSCLGFGSMTFKNKDHAKELLATTRKYGINFFDNAETYGQPLGKAEEYFGEALAELQKEDPLLYRRSDLVISTKLFWGPSGEKDQVDPILSKFAVNELGTSMKHIIEGMDASLKRLKLDYVDIVFAHRYDNLTPMLETVRGFTKLINDGKAFYWGTSMWPAQKITEAYWIAKIHNLIPPIAEQPVYNMFNREPMEKELLSMFELPYNIGTTIWSPLDSGVLTGKYNKEIPKDSRLGDKRWEALYGAFGFYDLLKVKTPKVAALMEYCKKELNGASIINLALAWTLKNKNVSVCLLGGSKSSQIDQNVECIALAKKLTNENMQAIDKILDNTVKPDMNLNMRQAKKLIQTIN